jgi:hypothetical protein
MGENHLPSRSRPEKDTEAQMLFEKLVLSIYNNQILRSMGIITLFVLGHNHKFVTATPAQSTDTTADPLACESWA